MANFKTERQFNLYRFQLIAAVIFSGLCWYISNGLNGDYWYLLWLAPVPILVISFEFSSKTTFWIAFVAYLIGRLSWFSYLVSVATIIPAIVFTIALPLIFSLIIVLSQSTIRKIDSWYAVFIFPVFFTAFEWLLINFSPDGSAASIAYSQSEMLSLIQIASFTGILGITFIVTFIPSALSLGWMFRNDRRQFLPLSVISVLLLTSVFFFGFSRMKNISNENTVPVGLIVLSEKTHSIDEVDFQVEIQHIKNYAQKISDLAQMGAKIITLPERAININSEIDSIATNILIKTAKQNNITIVVGYTNLKSKNERNGSLVIDGSGNVLTNYTKAHLVKGLEDRFTPGDQIGTFSVDKIRMGTAICKDLDFPKFIRNYGKSNTTVLFVPAWDFVVDDWLHSRMAILRGVENGFTIIRTARLGRLTISDRFGNVVAETGSANGQEAFLLGQISLTRSNTLYTQYGDWFGLAIVFSSVFFILLTIVKKRKLVHE